MKRLGWGIMGSMLVMAFNVSASVTPLCSSQGDEARCLNDDVRLSRYTTSATSSAAEGTDSSTVAASSSYGTPPASSSYPSSSSRTSQYDPDDDSCE